MTTLQTRPQTAAGVLRALEQEARRNSERRTQERADPRVLCSGESQYGGLWVTYTPGAALVRRRGKLTYTPACWYWYQRDNANLTRAEALKVLKEQV